MMTGHSEGQSPDLEQSLSQNQPLKAQQTQLLGQQLSPEQEEQIKTTADHWRRVSDEAPIQAMSRAEESAKQLIGLTGALQAVYVGIYAFSDIRKQLGGLSVPLSIKLALFFLYFLPLLMWLISLFYAVRFFVVMRVHADVNLNDLSQSAWQRIKQAYEEASLERMRRLHQFQRALFGMIFSTGMVLLLLGALIFLLPAPASEPIQIIILTPTPVVAPTPTP